MDRIAVYHVPLPRFMTHWLCGLCSSMIPPTLHDVWSLCRDGWDVVMLQLPSWWVMRGWSGDGSGH